MHEDGKENITDIFTDGDSIGFSALIEEKNYEDNAVILEEADIMQIPKEDFLQMIYGNFMISLFTMIEVSSSNEENHLHGLWLP